MTREQIIDAHPLLQYCQARGIELRREGTRWKALCPLHNEKTASFYIGPDPNLWHCFGCGAGGSIVDLHMALNNLSVGEAMAELGGGDRGHDHEHQQYQQKPKHKEPDSFSDEKAARLRKTWPAFDVPTSREIEIIAGRRGLSTEGVAIAAGRGLLLCADSHEGRMWVVSDSRRINAQGRRFDGRKWVHIGNKKAWTLPGSIAAWPIGIREAQSFPSIALVEGAPDLIAGFHLAWIAGQEERVAPVAMLGSMPIPKQALPLFANKRVRLFGHFDKETTGGDAETTRGKQLRELGIHVDRYDLSGFKTVDGEPVKDLCDFCHVDVDQWEQEREAIDEAFTIE